MQPKELLDWVVKQDADTVQAWLNRVWAGQQEIPENFDWQNLTAAIDVLAKAGKGPKYYTQPDLVWAKVAVSLYLYLIEKADPFTQVSLTDRMMGLKAYLIVRL